MTSKQDLSPIKRSHLSGTKTQGVSRSHKEAVTSASSGPGQDFLIFGVATHEIVTFMSLIGGSSWKIFFGQAAIPPRCVASS